MKPVDTKNRSGYIFAEILVAVVVFGIVMIPVVHALWLLPRVGHGIHQQSRSEAWRSIADRAVTAGVDPSNAPVMAPLTNSVATAAMIFPLSRTNTAPRAGAPLITVLSGEYGPTAEQRAVGAGYEVGAGAIALPPRTEPLPPLPPIVVSDPTLNPPSGTWIPVGTLIAPLLTGAPFTSRITSTAGGPSSHVWLQQTAPISRSTDAPAAASIDVDADDLARSVRGRTWAEYTGNPATDTPVALGDGRTRWLVAVGPRVQAYEPSALIGYAYGVDIGRPVYAVGGSDFASGGTVPIDISLSKQIESRAIDALIEFPASVRGRFGSSWGAIQPTINWTFNGAPGDSSAGNTLTYFTSAKRNLWTDTQTLTATPVSVFGGLRALSASWTISRTSIVLGPPERNSSFYNADTDNTSTVDFSAPLLPPTNLRVGRPKIDNVESVSATLSTPLLPP